MIRKRLAAAVAMVALSAGSAAWAADNSQPIMLDTTAPATPTTLTPIMYLLDPTPFGKWMENNKISVTGFAEGGYFYDTSAPRMGASAASGGTPGNDGDAPTFVSFPGGFSNRGVLDQVDLQLSKSLDTTKSFDYGGFVEIGYGVDDAQIHSYGLLDHRSGASPFNKGNTEGVDPDNQFDIVQLYGQLLLPLGSGLTLEGGKFVGFLSQEVINPTGNAFYTHSYNFFYGVPATNTGVTGSYTFAKLLAGNDVTVTGGVTRGWNESLRDNNGAVDFVGQVKGSVTPKLSYVLNLEEGPEGGQPTSSGTSTGPDISDNGDYWTTPEVILSYAFSDQLTFTSDSLYSDDPHGGATYSGSVAGVAIAPGESNAQWYGEVLYASYKINSNFTANLRTEWYRDQGAFTTGTQANYYEATAGVDIHPFPNDNLLQWLQFRPEVRYDWSDRAVYNDNHNFNVADGTGGDYSQFSVAMDVLMQY